MIEPGDRVRHKGHKLLLTVQEPAPTSREGNAWWCIGDDGYFHAFHENDLTPLPKKWRRK